MTQFNMLPKLPEKIQCMNFNQLKGINQRFKSNIFNQRKPGWWSGGVPLKLCLSQKASIVSYFFLNPDYAYLCMLSI